MPPIRTRVRSWSVPLDTRTDPGFPEPILIDDDPIDIPDDEDVVLVRESLTVHASRDAERRAQHFRHGPIRPYWLKVTQISSDIRRDDVLELRGLAGFVHVKQLFTDVEHEDKVVIRGLRYQKLTEMFPSFESDSNEVILTQEVFADSLADRRGLYLQNFTLKEVHTGKRFKLIRTNKLREPQIQKGRMTDFLPQNLQCCTPKQRHNHIICRSKYTIFHKSSYKTLPTRVTEEMWMNLSEHEADSDSAVSERLMRQQGREARGKNPESPGPDSEISAMDCFCGAGFASEGAKRAGMVIKWAFDHNHVALESYRKNNHRTKSLRMDFFHVIERYAHRIGVDVMMISFPCQFFSPAHTQPGRNDDHNEVVMFGLADFLAKTKPRIVVIEQTFGLCHRRFREHLMAVVSGFRNNDYSIRKAVINFAGLGEASERRRLIIIGAA
ncbi:hypothetical protein ANO11243_008670 [Dothideomycetidae sp. 11243]|nr:hypothetical protein ANO11243_008670 [fungal sp. No.11243]